MKNDYIFTETDSGAIMTELISGYEKITGRTLLPADPDRIFISWIAAVIVAERARQNYIGNQNIPSRSSGANLDALGEYIYSLSRPGASEAKCTVRFHISESQETSILIPRGTRVSNGGTVIFKTIEDKYVEIGETFADVETACENAGINGNGFLPGQINTLIDVDRILYYVSCENINISHGGADEATDLEYFSLMRSHTGGFSNAGPEDAYVYLAKSVSTDIADVKALNDGPGRVAIYALMNDGTPATEEIKTAIVTACRPDNKRPMTDYVDSKDPECVNVDLSITYYIPTNAASAASEIENRVKDAVEEYIKWQCTKLGRDIDPSELIYRVKQTGIKRADVSAPNFVQLENGDNGTPQVAKFLNVKIINGGYEDD